MKKLIAMSFGLSLCFSNSLMADTTDQKWMNKVELTKTGMHCSDDANCFNRYHPDIPSKARGGRHARFHTRDALDTEFRLDSTADDLATVDLGLVHPMTGPIHISGAKRRVMP